MLWPPHSTGYDVDMPWRDLPKEDQDWIIYTDETPFVPVHSWLTFSESKAAICPVCQGKRLKPEALIKSLVAGPRRPPCRMCDSQMCPSPEKRAAAVELASGISQRLRQLVDLRLGYLSLSRTTPTLSGGELQRLRLATQLSSDLFGVVYVLDEPSAGLHPQDVATPLGILDGFKGRGDSLFIVEHSVAVMRYADW